MACKIVVLVSGSGSNLQSLIDASQSADCPFTVAAVICNRPGAFGLTRAEQAGIAAHCIDHTTFASREAFDSALAEQIEAYQPELLVLAGFMRILTPAFVSQFTGRMLNIHPSLLPKYPGLHTHQRALDAGDTEAGATIHFVTADLDGGPSVVQARVPILEGDNAETLAARILTQEHRIYPLAVRWFAEGRLRLSERGVLLDDAPIPSSGVTFSAAQAP